MNIHIAEYYPAMKENKPFLHMIVRLDITNIVKGERYIEFKNRPKMASRVTNRMFCRMSLQ